MLFPDNIFQKLGFDEVKALVSQECMSVMGRDLVDKMQFISNYDLLHKLLKQTAEFKQVLQSGLSFPSEHYYDLKTLLQKVRIEGTFLPEEDFFKVQLSLQTVFACIHFFKEQEGLYPSIELLFKDLQPDKKILYLIEQIIDSKGKIKINASRALGDIHQAIQSAESDARKRINLLFKEAQKEGYTADSQLTIRDGRVVIPVLAEYKRRVKGVILDESATGQTVFIEPMEVFEINNRIRDLEHDKHREIVRILTALTDDLRPYLPLLLSYHNLLTIIDFIRAKARFAIRIDAALPVLKKEAVMQLYQARHPLLYLGFKEQNKEVIPLDIRIDDEQRIIVVSGPNAGGKSVCLKTCGLIQLMLQHGLLIPASEYSELGVFKNIFVDIGDDQSLESDLSTYSAHLSHMKYFVEYANANTFICIDEFGTGTDPKFGGPIAEAVLEVINRKKVKGVVTTHYSNLKLFANDADGIRNASMLFDTISMQALYRLEIGKPGSSYAFEIAQKTGLPKQVIELAKVKVGHEQKRVDSLLIDLERDKKILADTQKSLSIKEKQVSHLIEETEQLKSYLDENKKGLIRAAKQEAEQIIKQANKLIENTISEIKTAKADKTQTKKLREQFQEQTGQLLHEEPVTLKVKVVNEKLKGTVGEGSWVRIKESDTVGQVLRIQKQQAELAIGEIRSFVKLDRLELTMKPKIEKDAFQENLKGNVYAESVMDFNPQIDLRGKRGDEALAALEKFMDKAIMRGFGTLRILHGKGDGILRKLIREYLRNYSQIKSMEDEHVDFGGAGITLVHLK